MMMMNPLGKNIEKDDEEDDKISIGWRNLRYEVRSWWSTGFGFKRRPLLRRLNGYFEVGSLNGLMGPSGSGKTTLLNALSGNFPTGDRLADESEVYVLDSDHSSSSSSSSSSSVVMCCFVEQQVHKTMMTELTVGQLWRYAYRFKNNHTHIDQMERHIQDTAESLLLPETILDRPLHRCSGGEQKRVAIGQELMSLTAPRILMVDEPTTGLDSGAALLVMQALHQLAIRHRITVITSIHLPSSEVIRLFHRLYVLAKGGACIYAGSPLGIQSFLKTQINITVPSNEHPVETLIRVACNHIDSSGTVAKLANHVLVEEYTHFSKYLASTTAKSGGDSGGGGGGGGGGDSHQYQHNRHHHNHHHNDDDSSRLLLQTSANINNNNSVLQRRKRFTITDMTLQIFRLVYVTFIAQHRQLLFNVAAFVALFIILSTAFNVDQMAHPSSCYPLQSGYGQNHDTFDDNDNDDSDGGGSLMNTTATSMITTLATSTMTTITTEVLLNLTTDGSGGSVQQQTSSPPQTVLNCAANDWTNVQLVQENNCFHAYTILFVGFFIICTGALVYSPIVSVFRNEYRNHWYSLGVFYWSANLVSLLEVTLYTMLITTLAYFLMQQHLADDYAFNFNRFGHYFLFVWLLVVYTQSIGQLIGVLLVDYAELAVIMCQVVYILMTMLNGYFVDPDRTSNTAVIFTANTVALKYINRGLMYTFYGIDRCDWDREFSTVMLRFHVDFSQVPEYAIRVAINATVVRLATLCCMDWYFGHVIYTIVSTPYAVGCWIRQQWCTTTTTTRSSSSSSSSSISSSNDNDNDTEQQQQQQQHRRRHHHNQHSHQDGSGSRMILFDRQISKPNSLRLQSVTFATNNTSDEVTKELEQKFYQFSKKKILLAWHNLSLYDSGSLYDLKHSPDNDDKSNINNKNNNITTPGNSPSSGSVDGRPKQQQQQQHAWRRPRIIRKPKPILRNLNGHLRFGTLTALMGTSGAGKTSLLRVINGQCKTRVSEQTRWYQTKYTKINTCFITQEVSSHLMPGLTVKQSMLYASRLKCDAFDQRTVEEHEEMVARVLNELNLLDTADTVVDRCSGGQRQRLALALELTSSHMPNLICIDEPTSGLDSNSAELVVNSLKRIAHHHPICIVASIHQPNSSVLAAFDELYILARGGVCIYTGPVSGIASHLATLPVTTPTSPKINASLVKLTFPIDRLITLSCAGHDDAAVAQLVGSTTEHQLSPLYREELCTDAQPMPDGVVHNRARFTFHHSFRMLCVRYAAYIVGHLWFYLVASLVVIFTYAYLLTMFFDTKIAYATGCISLAEDDFNSTGCHTTAEQLNEQQQLTDNYKYNFFMTTIFLFMLMIQSSLIFGLELAYFINEHRNGWYSAGAFYLMKSVYELAPLSPIVLIYAYICNIYDDALQPRSIYWHLVSLLLLGGVGFQGMAHTLSILANGRITRITISSIFIFFVLCLTSNFFLPLAKLHYVYKILGQFSITRYVFEASLTLQYGFGRCGPKEVSALLLLLSLDNESTHDGSHYYHCLRMLVYNVVLYRLIAVWLFVTRVNPRDTRRTRVTRVWNYLHHLQRTDMFSATFATVKVDTERNLCIKQSTLV